MNTYAAFYKRQRIDLTALTSYDAQKAAAVHFKAKKPWEVTVMLLCKGADPVVHSGAEL